MIRTTWKVANLWKPTYQLPNRAITSYSSISSTIKENQNPSSEKSKICDMMKKAVTMEKPHTVLEKKLHELELQFAELFFPSAENPTNPKLSSLNPDYKENISKEVQARMDFLKALLMAEKECRSLGKLSVQLGVMEERLEVLNMAFRDWIEGREISRKDIFSRYVLEKDDSDGETLQQDGSDGEIFDEDGFHGEILFKDDFNGEISTCSCTRSCFSEEEDEDEDDDVSESECLELEPKKDEEKNIDREEVVKNRYCDRYFRVFGTMVTVAGIMLGVWMSFGGFEEEFSVPPT